MAYSIMKLNFIAEQARLINVKLLVIEVRAMCHVKQKQHIQEKHSSQRIFVVVRRYDKTNELSAEIGLVI